MQIITLYIISLFCILATIFTSYIIFSYKKSNKILKKQYLRLKNRFDHSQKMQSIGQITSSISHDFNNLLTGIIGFCDIILMKHKPNDDEFDDLMQIKQNANRAANLVKQLLAFSKGQESEPIILDIRRVIDNISILLAKLLGAKILLEIDHSSDPCTVKADQNQLEQIIVNLIVNARDAMECHGELYIKTSNVTIDKSFDQSKFFIPRSDSKIKPGHYVLIEISDTGSGISSEIMDKIFDPFFSTKDPDSGTGLGLSTVYDIVKNLGGYVRLETKKNHGSKFSIFLKQSNDKNISETIEETINLTLKPTGESMGTKILIVEDDIAVRMFVVQMLELQGYKVFQAENAEQAIDILDSNSDIELIIADIIMPGMNGLEMLDRVSSINPNIRFILTSGYSEDVVSISSSKKFVFLPKPFSVYELDAKVKMCLNSL